MTVTAKPVVTSRVPTVPIIEPRTGQLPFAWLDWFRRIGQIVNTFFNQQGQGTGILAAGAQLDSGVLLRGTAQTIQNPMVGGLTAYNALIASSPRARNFLQFNGTNWLPSPAFGLGVNTVTSNYVAAVTDAIIQMNSPGPASITLPVPGTGLGMLWLKNIGAGKCTVIAQSGTIDTHASWQLLQNQGLNVYWDGATWRIYGQSLAV